MYATIQKWGNSQAIRIPKGVLETADLHENDRVEIAAENQQIIIRLAGKKHKTIKERLAGYSEDYECNEWITGNNQGKEV